MKRAFTLIELLLVLVIIGIIAAVTAPSFIASIRGNRLRTSARSVIMAGRYARSMAVLKQQETPVTFDFSDTTVWVASEEEPDGKLTRKLDGITIKYIEPKNGERLSEGVHQIIYHSNGRCTPYNVKLEDENGSWILVKVDALSSTETEGGDI